MSDNGKMRVLFSRLWTRTDGASAIEFSLVAMPLILTLVGIIEVALVLFVNVLLEGAVRDSARYGITGYTEGGVSREQMIRKIVEERTVGMIDMSKVKVDTLVYQTFSDIGKPEPLTNDVNGNGQYDAGDGYADINGNGKWDADMGAAGVGGPGAVVVYRISYKWPLLTGLLTPLLGSNGYVPLSVSTAVRNEPFPNAAPQN
jgi:Flp pilus assembly protein TadG